MSATKVLIVDDQRIFRVMMSEILSDLPQIDLLGEATNGYEAIQMAETLQPEVVLMDIELGDEPNGVKAGFAIKAQRPTTGIVLFSTYKSREFIVNAPGWSYLLKNNIQNVDTVVRAINGAAWGMVVVDPEVIEAMEARPDTPLMRLAPEPARVLELMAQGFDNGMIATRLSINEKAVVGWQDHIYDSLGIEQREGIDPRIQAVSAYLGQIDQDLEIASQFGGNSDVERSVPVSNMTPEQVRVLEMVSEGFSDLAIAEKLKVDVKSVLEYLDVTYHQMGIGSDPMIDPRVTVAKAFSKQASNARR